MSEIYVPQPHMIPAIEEMIKKDAFGCFAFPGAGKTAAAIHIVYQFRQPTLVIAPLNIIYTTWLNEHKKWTQFQNLKLNVLHTAKDVEIDGVFVDFNKQLNFTRKAGIHLINPEGIQWLLGEIKSRKRFPWKFLFVDESIRFKNFKGKGFKALCKMIKSFKKRYLLCGNPIPNNFLDLWAQIYLLDFGKRLGDSWYGYRNKYFYQADYRGFRWKLREGAREQIIAKISDICTFVSLEDTNLKIPERYEIDRKIILPIDAREKYTTMEKKLFSEMTYESDVSKILAPSKGSALMKCWQIAQGFIYEYTDEKKKNRRTHYIHEENLTMVKSIVAELQGQPCIIAYQFNEDLVRLSAAFPKAPIAGRETTPHQLRVIEQNWNKGKITTLISQITKLSHGLNLQYGHGRTIILYTLTHNYDTYDQLIRRFQRQGAAFDRVIVIRIIADNTVHEAMLKTINRKAKDSNDFLSDLIEYRAHKTMSSDSHVMNQVDTWTENETK